jgi:hypothetical protein
MNTNSTLAHTTSLPWRNWFRRNLGAPLPFHPEDRWTAEEAARAARSLAQFELGESSDGRHFLEHARRFGERAGDSYLAETVALFIEEENRHAHWIGKFLRAQGVPPMRRHWLDTVFRWIRKPMGFGLMVSVLTCAEVVAVPYYSSLRKATRSQWLGAICTRILADERHHLRFQSRNLAAAWGRWRSPELMKFLHHGLLAATCVAVWREHGAVLRRGGYTLAGFAGHCRELLDGVHADAVVIQRSTWQTTISPAAP